MSSTAREKRLRNTAKRRGLDLHKSPTRDRAAVDYDGWVIEDAATGRVVAGTPGFGLPHFSLDDVEQWLVADAARREQQRG